MSFAPQLLLSLSAVALLLVGCTSDSPDPDAHDQVKIPLYLSIPKSDPATRAIRDPGTFEEFKKPSFLFLFVLNATGTAYHTAEGAGTTTATTLYPIALNPNNWKEEGSLYRYDNDLSTPTIDPYLVALEGGFQPHHVYVAASTDKFALTLGTTGSLDERIRNATFELGGAADDDKLDESQLQHLYSSPARLNATFTTSASGRKRYNTTDYRNTAGTVDGKDYQYYGNLFDADTNSPYLDIVLYHVAAKVDLLWNVKPEDRADVRLIQMTIEGLRRNKAKLFLPMDNVASDVDALHTGIYSLPLGVGDQWNGRHYFYALPYSKTLDDPVFPITLTYRYLDRYSVRVGTTSQQKPAKPLDIPFYQGALIAQLKAYERGIFVPWVRYNIAVNK